VLPTDSVDALGSDLVRQLIESGRTSSYFAQGGIVHELPSIRNLLPSSLTPDAISPQEQRLSEILHVGSTMPNELLMNASKAIGASVSSPTTVTIDARGALLDSYGMRQLAKKLQDEGGFWTHVGHNSNGEYTKARAAMNLPV
jgi:hypothetical protein